MTCASCCVRIVLSRPALRLQTPGNRHALVISCAHFLERGEVQFDKESHRSGESITKLLTELEYDVLHLHDPTQKTVQAALKNVAKPPKSDDESTTFIFYAGPVLQDEGGQLMMLFMDPGLGRMSVFRLGKWILDLQHSLLQVGRPLGLGKPAPATNMVFAIDGCSKRDSTGVEEPIPTPPPKNLVRFRRSPTSLCCIVSCAVTQHDRRGFSGSLLRRLQTARSAADLCDGISADCRNSGSRPLIVASGDLSAISLFNPLHQPLPPLPDEAIFREPHADIERSFDFLDTEDCAMTRRCPTHCHAFHVRDAGNRYRPRRLLLTLVMLAIWFFVELVDSIMDRFIPKLPLRRAVSWMCSSLIFLLLAFRLGVGDGRKPRERAPGACHHEFIP